MSFAKVLLTVPLDKQLDYQIPNGMSVAPLQLVQVNFQNKILVGVITQLSEVSEHQGQHKEIVSALPYFLRETDLKFINFVANYNMLPSGIVLKMMLPKIASCIYRPDKKQSTKIRDKFLLTTYDIGEIKLNSIQESVYNEIIAAISSHKPIVLHGVTGSGKTEVYMKIAQQVLKQGKQVLILLPEILLTTQMHNRFQKSIPYPIYSWHSGMTLAQKAVIFDDIIQDKARFIVGARSALFLPYQNLGLIIVDEEHDSSYKQEENGCYNAKDMAVVRAHLGSIPAILCSATPTMETEQNINEGKYIKFSLAERYNNSVLPKVELVAKNDDDHKIISDGLMQLLADCLSQAKQCLLYINRRGFIPVTICKNCHHKLQCPNCDFNLVLHKNQRIYKCHHCQYSTQDISKCSECGAQDTLKLIGYGIERVQEEVLEHFPQARTAVLSSDTLTPKNVSQVLKDIESHNIDILIGTQIISKGLHFPKLDMVAILDADSSLMSGDFRAHERTYQIMSQVSGRAGRESNSGVVVIQTSEANSPAIRALVHNNIDAFIAMELENRRQAQVPPFSRLVNVMLSSKNENLLLQLVNRLARNLPQSDEIRILGPTPAPVYVLRRRYRYRFIFIAEKSIAIQKAVKTWLATVTIPTSIKIKIDVDAINLA